MLDWSKGWGQVADSSDIIKGALARWGERVARVLFPPVCGGCRRHVSMPGSLCGRCWAELRFIERPWCHVLGIPFPHDFGEGAVSPAAIADPPPYERARAAVAYEGVARRMVQGLKFHGRTELAPWMARWMVRAGSELIADAELIVPVPLHGRRFFSRGFNQSAELARALAQQTGGSFVPDAVRRVKPTRQQVGLTAAERTRNVSGVFRVHEARLDQVRGRRVLVVDDVLTTGATVSALARALKAKGASAVDVLTFAMVLPGGFSGSGADPI